MVLLTEIVTNEWVVGFVVFCCFGTAILRAIAYILFKR
jgi:hypothetical protein